MDMRVSGENGLVRTEFFAEDGRRVSGGVGIEARMRLNGAEVKCLKLGGVGTEPEYRRTGLVRRFFDEMDRYALENQCLVTLLHPFSFSYYRKFGFERVADHRILEFPMAALNFAPFFRDMTPCTDSSYRADLAAVYNEFAKKRNIMFRRDENWGFPTGDGGKKTDLWYDATGKPSAYVVYGEEKEFCINRMASVNLHVYEMCFTSPEGLMKLLGFLRMFEGELDSVKIHNCAMSPEIERTLRHYTHTKITVVPDIMARINDVEAVLGAVRYPEEKGCFTVRVRAEEGVSCRMEKIAGAWRVEYEGGAGRVVRLDDGAECDLVCGIGALTQMVFGFESFGADAATYLPGVEMKDECADFFRAFPNRACGLFEHF